MCTTYLIACTFLALVLFLVDRAMGYTVESGLKATNAILADAIRRTEAILKEDEDD